MNLTYEQFQGNLKTVQDRLQAACAAAGRPATEVQLLPVTKSHPAEAARFAFEAGLRAVGENRVQEALAKREEVSEPVCWELIGPLQSNKARRAAQAFDRIQSVDRSKIAKALDRYADEFRRVVPILIQVNAGRDENKSGVSLEEAPRLLEVALNCANLEVEGLMTIAPLDEDPDVARRCFAALRECRDSLRKQFGVSLRELSMGMSGDMEQAVMEGSTLVRIGTALYGPR